jgi:hypothetical protein
MNNFEKMLNGILLEATYSITNLSGTGKAKVGRGEKKFVQTDDDSIDISKLVSQATSLGMTEIDVKNFPESIQKLPTTFAQDGVGQLALDIWMGLPPSVAAAGAEKLKKTPFPPAEKSLERPGEFPRWKIGVDELGEAITQMITDIPSKGGGGSVVGKGEIAAWLYFSNVERSSDKAYDLMANVDGKNEFISVKYFSKDLPRGGTARQEKNTFIKGIDEYWPKGLKITLEDGSTYDGIKDAIESNKVIKDVDLYDALSAVSGIDLEKMWKSFSFAVQKSLRASTVSEDLVQARYLLAAGPEGFTIMEFPPDNAKIDDVIPTVKFVEIVGDGRPRFSRHESGEPFLPQDLADRSKKRKEGKEETQRLKDELKRVSTSISDFIKKQDDREKLSLALTNGSARSKSKSDILKIAGLTLKMKSGTVPAADMIEKTPVSDLFLERYEILLRQIVVEVLKK